MKNEEVLEFINKYDEMSSEEVYEQLKPILDSYYGKDLANKIGCYPCQIYDISEFFKPSLKLYAKIMCSGFGNKRQKKQEALEKRKEHYKEYNHQYYLNVIKPAREKAKLRK